MTTNYIIKTTYNCEMINAGKREETENASFVFEHKFAIPTNNYCRVQATARLNYFTMPQQNLHAKLKDRVEEYNLSPEEVAAIDRARGQLSSHSMLSTVLNSHSASR